ncbi:helix-turn-helix domain-containing protein [Ruegeria atlantica]|uniref:helix-turn-helix domain-containing protein n=1 Tax=Ruegeria atlantica TaxID=81569 RepID=UPI00147B3940|nr:AraC family transcriptional regulator [Ruegeria atlantica]
MAWPLTAKPIRTSLMGVMLDMAIIDTFLRGSAVGVLYLCALIFLTNGPRTRKSLAVVLLCLSLGPYVVVSSPSIDLSEGPFRFVLVMISGVIPALIYWAAIELFQDDVIIHPWQIVVAALIVVTSWLTQLQFPLGAVRGACVLIFFLHMLNIVLSGEVEDLIADRRRFRRWFLVWLLTLGIIITVIEITHLDRVLPYWVFLLQAAAILVSASAFLVWSVRVAPDIWIEHPGTSHRDMNLKPAQVALIKRIDTAMAAGLWREEGLTVARMAANLGTQEHRLRSAINQGMGHRNFTSFVNAFRVREAQALLEKPEMAERTVLSIAFDVGFSSLGPFNRAFRTQTGKTPTEYRNEALLREE